MSPFFSVIVPVYNTEQYIARCVESLLNQTCDDYEIILVDDGSTDGSGAMCDFYAERDSRIRTVHKENGGLASARNAGLGIARGRYVSFVDSDDWLERDAYQVMRDALQDQQTDILNFGYQKIRDGQVLLREHAAFPDGAYDVHGIRESILPDSIACRKAFDQVNLPVQLSSCMCVYRNDFLKDHSIVFRSEREILCEDWLFNICCLCRAERVIVLYDIFYNYDTREGSLSMSYKPDSYIRRTKLFEGYRKELEKTGNDTRENLRRLKNFWMESIYCCYIIECHAPAWSAEVRQRMDTLSRDLLFRQYSRKLGLRDCTLKGFVFLMSTRMKLHRLFWLAYRRAKRRC